jgi:hypothetical protein
MDDMTTINVTNLTKRFGTTRAVDELSFSAQLQNRQPEAINSERSAAMRIERSAISVSWIPSDSLRGPLKLPWAGGIMHYDPPPPLVLGDLEAMWRRGEFRFANRLGAYIDVEDGTIVRAGYTGGLLMGLTPVTVGPLRLLLPTKGEPEIRLEPRVSGDEATFVQTAGGRPLFSVVKPSKNVPFVVTRPFTIWTTIELTIRADGSSSQHLAGASLFPRHWLYDDAGELVEKSALTRVQLWSATSYGRHTPWGGEDREVAVSGPESALERSLAEQMMRGDEHPVVRRAPAGAFVLRQGEPGRSVLLVLDGNLEVRVDGRRVGDLGPGAVIGERSGLEAGCRTADVVATTEVRLAELSPHAIDAAGLRDLVSAHNREGALG